MMKGAARKLLDEFDALAESERREVAVEILRRADLVDYGALGANELLSAADQIFLDLEASGCSELPTTLS